MPVGIVRRQGNPPARERAEIIHRRCGLRAHEHRAGIVIGLGKQDVGGGIQRAARQRGRDHIALAFG